MSLLTGANLPYDLDATDPRRWDILAALRCEQLVIPSHYPAADLHEVIATCPDLKLVHVRVKGNDKWWPGIGNAILDRVEYDGTPSPRSTVNLLLEHSSADVVLVWFNEPDLELTPDWQADNPAERTKAWSQYFETVYAGWAQAEDAYGRYPRFGQALAPLSQGAPDRFNWWLAKYLDSPFWRLASCIVEHCYFPSGSTFDDPDWGGRYLRFRDDGRPVDIAETNDNGTVAAGRDINFAAYAESVVRAGVARSLSLFRIPGDQLDRAHPSWWQIDMDIARATRAAVDAAAVPEPAPAPYPVPPPETLPIVQGLIKAVDVSSNNLPRTQAVVDAWVGLGAQLLIVKSYSDAEQAGLDQTTRDWARFARQAGLWHLPYAWLYRSVPVTPTCRSAVALWEEATGAKPAILFLDAETYLDSDPGPTVVQILEADFWCKSQGIVPVLYSGAWWLNGHLQGDKSQLAGMPVWLADYSGGDSLDINVPLGLDLVGRQYTSTPVDLSTFDLDKLAALIEALPGAGPSPEPPPADTPPESTPDALQAALWRVADLESTLAGERTKLGVLTVNYADSIAEQADTILRAMNVPKVSTVRRNSAREAARQIQAVVEAMRKLKPEA